MRRARLVGPAMALILVVGCDGGDGDTAGPAAPTTTTAPPAGCPTVALPAGYTNSTTGGGDFDGDGRAEILVTSPWGIGVFKLTGNTFSVPMMAPNGTRFGGWLLNTGDNRLGTGSDYDGDRRAEILITSPWGIGILEQSGATMAAPMMAPNGTRFGGWLLNTVDNDVGHGV